MTYSKLPTKDKPPTGIDTWGLDKLSIEYRREANRERDGYYMSRGEFAHWCQAMAEWYRGKNE